MSGSFAESFADARPVAQHCAELTWRGPRPEERADTIAAWCRDLGTELAQELSQLFSGGKLRVSVSEPEIVAGKDVFERIGPVAVNSLLRCGAGDQTMLLSLDYATAIALADASFGGSGELLGEAPEVLPRSAAMLAEQCASMVAQVIAMANGSAELARGDVLVRSDSATRLKPFGTEAEVALFVVSIRMGESTEWTMVLAVANDRLDTVLPGSGGAPVSAPRTASPSDGMHGAFADMPMPLEAVLSEFELSLGRLEKLAPGDEIPLALSGSLPLKIGETVLANGALGTIENRMALRVTHVPHRAKGSASGAPPSSPREIAA